MESFEKLKERLSLSKNEQAESKPLFSQKAIQKLIIPLIIEQALAISIGFFDTVMVAYAGEHAVSGVSLVDSINFLAINFFSTVAAGGAIIVGQYLGRKDRKTSNHAAQQLFLVVTFIAVVVAIVCLLFNQTILQTLFGDVETQVMSSAVTYFYITAISFPFLGLFNVSASLLRVMGDSQKAMMNALIMNLINIVGNAIFIYIFKWGVFGGALSTLIARVVSSVFMVYTLRNPHLPVYVQSYSFRSLDLKMIKRILRVGVPNGLENSIFQIGKIIMTGLVATCSTASIAAHAVANSLTGLQIIPGAAMGLALTTIVSRCVGAGEFEQAKYYTKMLMKKAYGYIILLNIPILLLLHPILNLYGLSEESIQLAYQVMILHSIGAMLIWAPSFSLPNALRAAGDVVSTMYTSVFSMFVFRVGFSFLFAYVFNLGLISVWIAMMIDWLFRAIFFTIRWASNKWQRHSII